MAQLEVDLVAADRPVWTGTADFVSAPAHDGEIGILPGHSPMLAPLRAGKVRVRAGSGSAQEFEVSGGFISVDEDQVTIVADDVTSDANR
ncbi:MAG: F0F1 ATP synthase subunit epsilon [Cellulomonadaceae bacterium]